MNVLVTGSDCFIGRNLIARLATVDDVQVLAYDTSNKPAQFQEFLG